LVVGFHPDARTTAPTGTTPPTGPTGTTPPTGPTGSTPPTGPTGSTGPGGDARPGPAERELPRVAPVTPDSASDVDPASGPTEVYRIPSRPGDAPDPDRT
jgi:hypothetical protein